ncbi:hypothetical protein DFQ30_006772 [Apophysomyces sp. BC1015]|nr:hypothetical protein DFQ30_006772 [Apophysomyces sp. BC1015]
MFILFGVDQHKNDNNDFHVMDLKSLQWTTVFHADGQYSENSTKIPSATPIPTLESQGLAGGTIAGIVVGSIVGVAFITAIGAYLLIRKKRQQRGHVIDDEPSKSTDPDYKPNRGSQVFSYLTRSLRKPNVDGPTPRYVMSPVQGPAGGDEFDSSKPDGHIPQLNLESTKPDGV